MRIAPGECCVLLQSDERNGGRKHHRQHDSADRDGTGNNLGAVHCATQPGNGIADSSDVVRAHAGALGFESATQGAAPGCVIDVLGCWSDELCWCRWWDGNGPAGGFNESCNSCGHVFRSGQRHFKWRDAQGDRFVDSGLDPQELS